MPPAAAQLLTPPAVQLLPPAAAGAAGERAGRLRTFVGNFVEQVVNSTPVAPIIRSRERNGEQAVIWARPLHGDLFELLIFAHDPTDETVVVRVVVDGQMLARELADPKHPDLMAGK